MGARRVLACALIGGLLACSQLVGFDELQPTGAARSSADAGESPEDGGRRTRPETSTDSDAANPTTGRCDPTKPFGPPELVPELNPPAGEANGLAFSTDDLEAVYGVFFNSNFSMRHARRTSLDAAWTAQDMPLGRSVGSPCSISLDGLSLYTMLGPTEHFVLKRAATSVAFTEILGFDVSAVTLAEPGFHVGSSEERAYISTRGASASETFLSTVQLNGTRRGFTGSATRLTELHVAGAADGGALLNPAETVIYFHSTQPGVGDVLLRASRASKTMPFGPTTRVDVGPSTFAWAVSNDDCELYVVRNLRIHVARRPR